MRFSRKRTVALLIAMALILTAACAENSGEDETSMADAEVNRGIGDSSMSPDQGVDDMGSSDPDIAFLSDQGIPQRECEIRGEYRLVDALKTIKDAAAHTPDTTWNGSEWGVAWLQQNESEDAFEVRFRRFGRDGSGLSDEQVIGEATGGRPQVVSTDDGYLVAFINHRTSEDQFSGLRLRPITAEGRPAFSSIDLESTFDVHAFDLAWAPFAGGMLVYSRGRGGTGGAFSLSVDARLTPQTALQITDSTVTTTGVAFGDGFWGAVWLTADGESSGELKFALLDQDGGLTQVEKRIDGGGIGQLSIDYGQGTFGIAWSRRVEGPLPRPYLTLLESGGEVVGTLAIETNDLDVMALAHAVEWVGRLGFVVGWIERLDGDRGQAGVSPISAQGVPYPATIVPRQGAAAHRSVSIAGNQGRLGLWITNDDDPQPVGYSDEVRIQAGSLGICD